MDLFVEIEVKLNSCVERRNLQGAREACNELATQIHSVKDPKQRYEASSKLNRGKEKVNDLASRIAFTEDDRPNALDPKSQKGLSNMEREQLVYNDSLNKAMRQGRESEEVAISTKVHLSAQTE